MTKLFAVVGNPVAHSRSPQMHNAAFAARGVDAVYFRILAPHVDEVFSAAKAMGLSGMNVTSPFKEDVAKKVDKPDKDVRLLDACNTVIFENGKSSGSNTDPDGVVGALQDKGVRIKGKKAVVLGAGGAAKAAILALTKAGARVTCANRTVEKAQEIGKVLGCQSCGASRPDLTSALDGAEILVSCVTTHDRVVPKELLKPNMIVLDANYSAQSAIVADAKEAGCKLADPLGWLLFQGTTVFEKFTGKEAPLEAMRKAVFANYPDARKRRKIALIGFMGAGKSTVGKNLAEKAGLRFVETDGMIVSKAGKPITRIFAEDGEPKFREMEVSALKEAGSRGDCVVSCGGGIITKEENVKALQEKYFTVWLFVGLEQALERTKEDTGRPILNVKDKEAEARRRLDARLALYAKACHVMINTDGRSPEEIAGMIMKEIGIKVG